MNTRELIQLDLLFEKKTKFQTMRFYEDKDKKLWFTLDTYVQFIEGEDEKIYHYNLVNKSIELFLNKYHYNPETFLILGGGDGLACRNIIDRILDPSITLVEIDEDVINLFKNNKRLMDINKKSLFYDKLKIYIDDALRWIKETYKKFDMIILDFPDPNNSNLEKLYEKEFLKDTIKLLNKNGIISIQCHDDIKDKISKILKELLGNSKIINYEMPSLDGGKIVIGQNG